MVLKLSWAWDHLHNFLKRRLLGPPLSFLSQRVPGGLRVCTSNKLPGGMEAAGLEAALRITAPAETSRSEEQLLCDASGLLFPEKDCPLARPHPHFHPLASCAYRILLGPEGFRALSSFPPHQDPTPSHRSLDQSTLQLSQPALHSEWHSPPATKLPESLQKPVSRP